VPRATTLMVLRFSAPLVIGALGSMILNAGDRYVLAALRPPPELAYYSLASRFGGVVNMLAVQPLNLAWMPLLFRMREDQRPEVLRLLVPYLTLALCAGALLISLGAGPLLRLMGSDPSYARAVPLIPWVALGFAAFGLAVVTTGVLALFQRTRTISLGILLTAALNLGLNFALVPFLGATGSAVATFLSYLVLIVAHFRLIRPLVPNRYPWGRIAGIALATAAASFAVALRPYDGHATDWILRGAVFLAWAGMILAARWFTPREAREIWRVLRSR
jgi:O-antigen/teichoic acid export membrane protein